MVQGQGSEPSPRSVGQFLAWLGGVLVFFLLLYLGVYYFHEKSVNRDKTSQIPAVSVALRV